MSDLVEQIAAARTLAAQSLTAVTGTDSLCTLTRERLPAAKYHEGAFAALGEALRAARARQPLPVASGWGERWSRLAESDAAWRAYLVGGREALSALAVEREAR